METSTYLSFRFHHPWYIRNMNFQIRPSKFVAHVCVVIHTVHLAVGGGRGLLCFIMYRTNPRISTTNEKQIEGNHNRVCIIPNYDVQRIAESRGECGFMARAFPSDLF